MNAEELAAIEAKAHRDRLILDWTQKQNELEIAKAAENEARLKLAQLCFPDPKEGTNTLELGNGYKLKLEHKMNYTLHNGKDAHKTDGREAFATTKALNAIEKLGNEGAFIAERLVSWKPELSLTEYRALDKQYRELIDKALKISPATPSLKFETPKGK